MNEQAFLKRDIDLSPLGILSGADKSAYDATPQGAEILGWAGVDGVHYCTLPEYGETVFVVCPMNLREEVVRPVAEDFTTFLRLLLTHTEAALSQMGGWSRAQYDDFQCAEWIDTEQQAVRDRIAALDLSPLEDAYAYVTALQEGFDPSRIRFSKAWQDSAAKAEKARKRRWKVTFDGGFSDCGGQRGERQKLSGQLTWQEHLCLIPGVYLCPEGLVADLALGISARELQEREGERNSPLNLEARFSACVDGVVLRESCGYGCCWMPKTVRGSWQEPEGQQVVEYYDLDKSMGWGFWRVSFPWNEQGRPQELREISLTLDPGTVRREGASFITPQTEVLTFCHPGTGMEHTLQVVALEQGQIDPARFRDQTMEYPTHYTEMEYTVEPEVPRDTLMVRDVETGDSPRPKQPSAAACSVGLVMGARSKTPGRLAAASNLYFAPRESTRWQLIFQVREREPVTVMLK